ncbi:TIGR03936 family radical SAM-associated protein [Eubacterium coprostanoligenes]|uniref:TIGR03936 family radical SAM-associated protein n=1 Tax=Eubacterium coprostanoligenes TaxID=290054 RepID=UPI0023550081|nr:TIGR03936 family radical SAM-associated protein [Eubacterium coprostanoligenes]MCI6354293.1 TIGR03936 family radical SAM-associated protein [Eubacterium coprostanoligenes]MDD6665289.1 TIGR03936 family radical SAM-associated protein [Eubacterium coprostanoligenes]
MREVRLRFSKTGQAKYISHLDTNRVFSRALARAKINLWYTQGFNPRPYMSFSLPLSLGVESYCENVDLRILDDLTDEEIKERMNNALPLGIRIVDVYEDFMDCHDIVYSDYVYKFEFKDNETALEKINAVLESDEILAQKKAKQGKRRILKETDIKQFIVKYNASIRDNNIVLNIRLLAGPDKNLNPTLLFDTIIRLIDMDYEWKSIGRISLLTKDFKEYK